MWGSPLGAAVLVWAAVMAGEDMLWPAALAILLFGAIILGAAMWVAGGLGARVSCPLMAARLAQAASETGMQGASAQAAQLSMGLMMASLAVSGDWCSQAGWPLSATLALHLLLMALAAGLSRCLQSPMHTWVLAVQQRASMWRALCLSLGGLLVWLRPDPHGLMLCMACHSLAWGLSTHTPAINHPLNIRAASAVRLRPSAYAGLERWVWAAFSGVSLAWIAWGAASWGAMVLVWAHGAVSAVGLLALLAPLATKLVMRREACKAQGRTPGVSKAMP
jgi:hypothetical protein